MSFVAWFDTAHIRIGDRHFENITIKKIMLWIVCVHSFYLLIFFIFHCNSIYLLWCIQPNRTVQQCDSIFFCNFILKNKFEKTETSNIEYKNEQKPIKKYRSKWSSFENEFSFDRDSLQPVNIRSIFRSFFFYLVVDNPVQCENVIAECNKTS